MVHPRRYALVVGLAASVAAAPSPTRWRRQRTSFVPQRQCRQCHRRRRWYPHRTPGPIRTDGSSKSGPLSAWWEGSGGGVDRDGPERLGSTDGTSPKRSTFEQAFKAEIRRAELEVEAEAMDRLDRRRVAEALYDDDYAYTYNSGEGSNFGPSAASNTPPPPPSPWSVSLAAGGAAAGLAFLALHSVLLSSIAFAAVTYLATRDPLEEEGWAGALSRILGRWTLRSVGTATPKVRAAIRAAAAGEEEVAALRARVRQLEAENAALRTWAERRRAVDDGASRFSLDQLRAAARERGVPYSGRTKAELMMALLEEGALDLSAPGEP